MKFFKYLFVLLFLIICINTIASHKTLVSGPIAKNGVLDLRSSSLSRKIPVNGEWFFYWNQLLSPGSANSKKGTLVDFPFLWTNHEVNGQKLPSIGYATYKLTILLPQNETPIRIGIPDMYSAYRLYINGDQVAVNGKVSTSKENFEPYWQYQTVDISPGTDTLKMVLQISNFDHSRGGIAKPLYIGYKYAIEQYRVRAISIDLFLTGCLFMGGLFFLGLYLLGNKDKATLLFSLFCIIYSYRIMGVEDYILHTIFPGMDWYITIRIEYLTLFSAVGIFGLYTRYLYIEDTDLKITWFISTMCFIFSALSLILPPLYFSQLINPFLIVMVICIIYTPYIYFIAYKNKRPGSIFALLSAVMLMGIFAITLLNYWHLTGPLQPIIFILYICFFFLQSLILSHRVSFTLKKARQEAEQGLKAKSEFLSTMSHEIRTPLNSVIGMSHLLLKKDPRPDQIEKLDVMLFSANNLLAIVNDILDYNKIEAGKVSFEHIEMDILLISRNIMKGLKGSAGDKGIELKLNIDKTIKSKLLGDPTRITQVLSNLIHNGIKFTKEGSVELILFAKEQCEKSITIEFRVKDTGIGISAEKQKLIFERFTQADSSTSRGFGGTGLGLAISKKILELQNSSLHLESTEGQGSDFYFIQSFEKCLQNSVIEMAKITIPLEEDKPLSGIKILLVEDNPMNVLVAQKFLERWGAKADIATNGLEALEMVDPARHSLVLIDLHMPVMDGYEASKKMREIGIKLPIIALTANLPKEVEEKVRKSGIDDIVVKPFLPDELYRMVLNYVFKIN
jgi:signal transduction histidine kinase/CheY-like chemotaxis protein